MVLLKTGIPGEISLLEGSKPNSINKSTVPCHGDTGIDKSERKMQILRVLENFFLHFLRRSFVVKQSLAVTSIDCLLFEFVLVCLLLEILVVCELTVLSLNLC